MTPVGYVVRGECPHGRCEVRFGCNEVVKDAHFSRDACEPFRAAVLRVFGPGGPRKIACETFDPRAGLGKRPLSQLIDDGLVDAEVPCLFAK
jgi:hypothetical protein